MLDKLILIEDMQKHQFSDEKTLIKYLFGDNYFNQTVLEKRNLMTMNALSKCFRTNLELLELEEIKNNQNHIDVKNKFIIYDEKTYVLSLLKTNRVMLLEEINSNIYTKELKKNDITDNYIIVNTFAEELLDKYVNAY